MFHIILQHFNDQSVNSITTNFIHSDSGQVERSDRRQTEAPAITGNPRLATRRLVRYRRSVAAIQVIFQRRSRASGRWNWISRIERHGSPIGKSPLRSRQSAVRGTYREASSCLSDIKPASANKYSGCRGTVALNIHGAEVSRLALLRASSSERLSSSSLDFLLFQPRLWPWPRTSRLLPEDSAIAPIANSLSRVLSIESTLQNAARLSYPLVPLGSFCFLLIPAIWQFPLEFVQPVIFSKGLLFYFDLI